MMAMRRFSPAVLVMLASNAAAHAGPSALGSPLGWTWEPWVVGTIAAAAFFYGWGLCTLWRRAGPARGVRRGQVACFAAGLATLILALMSPLDVLGAQLFSAHMAQHELLMLIAAPLLIIGRPVATGLWAMPPRWRRWAGGTARGRRFAAMWATITAPTFAWLQHATVIWTWHAPLLFDAALANRAIHTLQHLSFLASALLFWWVIMPRPGPSSQAGPVSLYLFTTMLHTGALGALLALSPAVWYSPYKATALAWGLSPLEDQQLGGLIMWIPAGAVYAAAGLLLMGRWLHMPHSTATFRYRER